MQRLKLQIGVAFPIGARRLQGAFGSRQSALALALTRILTSTLTLAFALALAAILVLAKCAAPNPRGRFREILGFGPSRFLFQTAVLSCVNSCHVLAVCTANLRTKILDFQGFDSNSILSARVELIMSLGGFTEV